jgi:hypothetical protein
MNLNYYLKVNIAWPRILNILRFCYLVQYLAATFLLCIEGKCSEREGKNKNPIDTPWKTGMNSIYLAVGRSIIVTAGVKRPQVIAS